MRPRNPVRASIVIRQARHDPARRDPPAAARIAGAVHRTPVFTSRTLGERAGMELHLTWESPQKNPLVQAARGAQSVALVCPLAYSRDVNRHRERICVGAALVDRTRSRPAGRAPSHLEDHGGLPSVEVASRWLEVAR